MQAHDDRSRGQVSTPRVSRRNHRATDNAAACVSRRPDSTLSVAQTLRLQRTVGNAAVGALIGRGILAAPGAVKSAEPVEDADSGVRAVNGTSGRSPSATGKPRSRPPRPVTQRAPEPGPLQATVQRETSKEMLTRLAVPQIGAGPSIEVQQAMVPKLEKIVAKKYADIAEAERPETLDIGGFFIDDIPPLIVKERDKGTAKEQNQQFRQLKETKLVPLAKAGAMKTPITDNIAAEVVHAGLGPKVVENTLRTMIDADQIKYLRTAGLPNGTWTILANVHYIRARPKDMAGFHKDTQGQSLFVNLNYNVEDATKKKDQRGMAVRGPEYVLNPPRSDVHEKLISGDHKGRRGDTAGLPERFMKDLKYTRKKLGDPKEIKSSGTVAPYGYVAFVDEAIHHATPWFGHRYVTALEFEKYLDRNFADKLAEIRRTRGRANKVDTRIIDPDDIAKWKQWLKMLKADGATNYTRKDFAATMKSKQFNTMLNDVGAHADQSNAARAHGAAAGFYAASISNPMSGATQDQIRPPLTNQGRALRREASREHLWGSWPSQLPDHVQRRFFRTWVRAVRRDDLV